MHRTFLLVALALVGVALFASPGSAQPGGADLTLIGRYQFLPRFSDLHETGGFPGVDIHYRVFGKFELHDTSRLPNADGFPHFRNVDAWASHPILAYVRDLDETLNLTGLIGHQLVVDAPFDIYEFRGKNGESPVKIHAALFGPWLYMRGGMSAPPGGADFYEYGIKALARRRPFADFNQSDAVDREDLSIWMKQFGASSLGDADGDGLTDGADFLAWQNSSGEVAPSIEKLDSLVVAAVAAAGSSATAVPEPASIAMLVVAAAGFAAWRRPKARGRGPSAVCTSSAIRHGRQP